MARGFVWPRQDVLHTLERGNIAAAFYRAEADKYIGSMVVFDNVEIDIAATAEKIGIPIEYDATMPEQGRYVNKYSWVPGPLPRILLMPGDAEISLTFGHEVGHHFLDEELNIGSHLVGTVHEPISEAFCEFFGHKMARVAPADEEELERHVKQMRNIPEDYETHIWAIIMTQPPQW